MDYKRIQEITDEFIQKHPSFVKEMPNTIICCRELFGKEVKDTNYDWSRSFTVNESVDIVYNFLKSISQDLANQYYAIITSVNENNEPYVNFVDSKIKKVRTEVNEDGYVTVCYNNSPQDIFDVLHEMLHKMNECTIEIEDQKGETTLRSTLTETVSIFGEMLLGDYLVKNNIITEADYAKFEAWRLSTSKNSAADFVVENELIKLRVQGVDINKENALEVINNYDINSMERKLLDNHKLDFEVLYWILETNQLHVIKQQRYIIGQVLSERMYKTPNKIERFLKLHDVIGGIDAQQRFNKDILFNTSESNEEEKIR